MEPSLLPRVSKGMTNMEWLFGLNHLVGVQLIFSLYSLGSSLDVTSITVTAARRHQGFAIRTLTIDLLGSGTAVSWGKKYL